ncbi:hypothetical protein IKP13_08085 [bacterium]|nr:hypothetical protein [bacterium]
MIGYWVSFGVLFPVILLGCFGLMTYAKKHFIKEITPDIKREVNKKMVALTFFYWLCNLFYMSCFIKNDMCKYVFGGLVMLVIFMNLASTFSFPKEKSTFEKLGLAQDFLVGVGLSIYLICIIPNDSVKEVVIPIVAAVYGGLITLTGVAWTIRRQDSIRIEEEKRKYKPLVFIRDDTRMLDAEMEQAKEIFVDDPNNRSTSDGIHYVYKSGESVYRINSIFVQNTELAYCSLKGIVINEDLIYMIIAQVFNKNQTYRLVFQNLFSFEQRINSVSLLLEDVLENHYCLTLNYAIEKEKDNIFCITIKSGGELKETSVTYLDDAK